MVDWLIITATAKTGIIIFILWKMRASISTVAWHMLEYNLIYFYFLLKIDVFSLILGKN